MDKIIHLSQFLKCTPAHVFRYFSHNDLLESWLASIADVEPTQNGKYELFWDPNDKNSNSTIGCKITSIEVNKFLSFEWKSPKQFELFTNNVDPLTHVVVFFIQHDSGTELHLIHSGWRSTKEWEEARQWQIKAWQIALSNLSKRINQ